MRRPVNNIDVYQEAVNIRGHRFIRLRTCDGYTAYQYVHDPECPACLEGRMIHVFGGKIPYNRNFTENDASRALYELKDEYDSAFHGDEAEEWDDIVNRILQDETPWPNVVIYGALLTDRRYAVGALIAEHYLQFNVLLITYCFIRESARGGLNDYAKTLVSRGVTEICRQGMIQPRMIVFEGENPDKMSPEQRAASAMDPASRRRWFKKLGGVMIDIGYVQPPLARGDRTADFCTCLDLYAYCPLNENVDKAALQEFLKEFYGTLLDDADDEQKIRGAEYLMKMYDDIDGL